jgi:hypothetical protein
MGLFSKYREPQPASPPVRGWLPTQSTPAAWRGQSSPFDVSWTARFANPDAPGAQIEVSFHPELGWRDRTFTTCWVWRHKLHGHEIAWGEGEHPETFSDLLDATYASKRLAMDLCGGSPVPSHGWTAATYDFFGWNGLEDW